MECLPQHRFYEKLAEQLIENNYGHGVERRNLSFSSSGDDVETTPTSDRNEHLTPTKKRRRLRGRLTKAVAQGWCAQCGDYKSKFVCSGCCESDRTESFFIARRSACAIALTS